uniref:Mannosyl-oligosaccharide 1,2-alpha-mannosidase MNS3 n=1 Tax=Anthurium amnicola TaxID=1678845 RepID=A0A1D1XD38_9ARAE
MKGLGGAKLILVQPSLHKHGGGASSVNPHRFWLLALVTFFTFASLLTLFTKPPPLPSSSSTSAAAPSLLSPHGFPSGPLPADVFDALLHYATVDPAPGSRMPDADVRAVAATLRRRAPCNLLVFGMGHETLLWRSLNRGGRTVFLDESEYYVARLEERHPGLLEAYDVGYTTKVSELPELLAAARAERGGDCRPVQNLLFSDCRLGINDLPNQLYDVAWDVILVDGPRGYSPSAPGRISAIFTSAVMARSAGAGRANNATTEVFVHDYEREVEKVSSEEFLCPENLVAAAGQLAHFAIPRRAGGPGEFEFCPHRNSSSSSSSETAAS